jgi:hypothetical protein
MLKLASEDLQQGSSMGASLLLLFLLSFFSSLLPSCLLSPSLFFPGMCVRGVRERGLIGWVYICEWCG